MKEPIYSLFWITEHGTSGQILSTSRAYARRRFFDLLQDELDPLRSTTAVATIIRRSQKVEIIKVAVDYRLSINPTKGVPS